MKASLSKSKLFSYDGTKMVRTMYRPFRKKCMYYDQKVVRMPGIFHRNFGDRNRVILTSGRGAINDFLALATDLISI